MPAHVSYTALSRYAVKLVIQDGVAEIIHTVLRVLPNAFLNKGRDPSSRRARLWNRQYCAEWTERVLVREDDLGVAEENEAVPKRREGF